MEEIIEIGAVLSEYPPGIRPRKEYFPRRNALISAWVDKLLVVEATEKSGAIITAKITKGFGKEVYAVPNSIYTEESKGTNRLIRDGAYIFLEHEQLLPNQGVSSITKLPLMDQQNANRKITTILGGIEKTIYERLDYPMPPEELLDLAEGDFARLSDLLFKMELDGMIQTLPGNLISRT